MNEQVNYAKIQRIQDDLEALTIGQFGTGFVTDAMLYESGIKNTVASHTSQLVENTKYDIQSDYIEIIKSLTSYKTARFRKIAANDYALCVDNGNRHVTYNLIKDTNDDFIKIDDICYGDFSIGFLMKSDAETRTGTWVTSYPPNYYASVVGATFTCQVKGNYIEFQTMTDNRGGVWEFVIDDKIKKQISVYSAASVSLTTFVLATDLELNKLHTVVGTFKGDDPNNTPSGGVGTSRGWIYYNPSSDTNATIVGRDSRRNNNTIATIVPVSSNKEMAISISYGTFSDFVPEHGSPCTYAVSPPKFILDGVEVDISTLNMLEWIEFTDFKLLQNCKVTVSGTDIATLIFTHKLDKSGVLTYSAKLTALQNYTVNLFYPAMLPINQTLMTEFLTSIGNSHISTGDETEYNFTESDKVISVCGVSATNKDYISAIKVLNPRKSMRIGETVGKPTVNLKVWQRATAPKAYFVSAKDTTMQVGESYKWSCQIACAKIENIYEYVK